MSLGCCYQSTWECKKECCYLLTNMITLGTFEHVYYIMNLGIITFLSDCLNKNDIVITRLILNAIKVLLSRNKKNSQYINYCNIIEETCLDKIEKLQDHDDEKIYELSVDIIEKHYSFE